VNLRAIAASLALLAALASARADDDESAQAFLDGKRDAAAKDRPSRSVDGRWYETDEDGKETVVALSIVVGGTRSGCMTADDALAIAAEELVGLRSLRIEGGRDARLDPLLAKIDPARCFVAVEADKEGRLPPLPDGLRALEVTADTADAPLDLAPLATQTRLRWLLVYWGKAATLAPLATAKDLAWLHAPMSRASAETLPTLPALRAFTLGYKSDVADVAFVAKLPSLVKLDLGRNHVRDLTAIGATKSLVRVEAECALVERLPAVRVPALRFLDICSHVVPGEELRAFLDANPACEVVHDWRAALVARTAGVDGLRVRQMYPGDAPPALVETHEADVVRAFLELIRIDDKASGSHCMCEGDYVIHVLRGADVAADVTIHHGHKLRSDFWPGDAFLTDDSADAVCAWLVARGIDAESPRMRAARVAKEAKARDAAQETLLGAEHAAALRACKDDAAVAAFFAERAPDAVERVVLAVRFLAIDSPSDDDAGGRARDRVIRWLENFDDPASLAAAFERLLASAPDAAEAARRFETFDGRDADKRFPADALPRLRLAAARLLLESKSESGRIDGVRMLGRIGDTPEAREVLLGLLPAAGEDGRPATPTTDSQMEAAWLVVEFCEPSMLPRLQAMADGAKDARRWKERMTKWIAKRTAAEAKPATPDAK